MRSTSARSSGCGGSSSRRRRAATPSATSSRACARELFEDRVYVLTPKGEVIDLPRGATPLDFAYHVHTSLGHRCRGAKVNGRIVPLTPRARQRRDRRDHHRQARGAEPRLARARAGIPRLAAQPRQGARLVPQAGRRRQPQCRPRASPSASCRASAACARAARGARRASSSARDLEHFHQLLGEGEITRDAADARRGAAVRTARPPARSCVRRAPRRAAAPRPSRSKGSATCRRRWRAVVRRCARSRSPAT